ncbi:hypothetical protein N5P32_02540 [Marinomonas pontica]|uniref:hypothetical protein n=1 Tax=Marinomonas pontica TaxID=264739 RepID=UPI0022440183|nr:hypothetical protein [Marinomonas pontica]MCW8354852.1 hypothetical protein [Marinomonas pontica]
MACFRVCLLRIGLLTVTVLLGFANTAMAQIVGSAYSVKTGELLYRETHQQINDSAYSVEYSEPNGEVFAHKTLDFSQSKITPSFLQLNERNGERIDVKQSGPSVDRQLPRKPRRKRRNRIGRVRRRDDR